jgi:Ni/Co efflux regulator RcnB
MKLIRNYVAVTVIAALIGTGTPAMAAQDGADVRNGGGMRYQSADHRGDREWNDKRSRELRNDNRSDRDRRNYDRSNYDRSNYDRSNYDRSNYDRHDYDRGSRYDRGYSYGYAGAPVYSEPVYDDGYQYRRTHNGRTAAIIGGSAAGGALIGAAAGHGQGAVIGAVIGAVAGAAVSAAADHHDRY